MSMPSASSVSSERSFLRRLTSETLNRSRSNRGIIQLNRRLTPCIRDPSQPRWSQTCRILSGLCGHRRVFYLDTADRRAVHFSPLFPASLAAGSQPARAHRLVRSTHKDRRAARPIAADAPRLFAIRAPHVRCHGLDSGMKRLRRLLLVAAACSCAAGCEVEKSENPLSPTVAGPIPGVEITAPKPLEPGSGAQISGDKQPVTLLLENASSNGATAAELHLRSGHRRRLHATRSSPAKASRPATTAAPRCGCPTRSAPAAATTGAPRRRTAPTPAPIRRRRRSTSSRRSSFDKPTPMSPINNEQVSSQSAPEFEFGNAPRAGHAGSSRLRHRGRDQRHVRATARGLELSPSSRVRPSSAAVRPASEPAALLACARVPGRHPRPVVRHADLPDAGARVAPAPTRPAAAAPEQLLGATRALTVVQCRRSQVRRHMAARQTLDVPPRGRERSELNGVAGSGPFGILQKPGGVCGGYSCDIICTGQGTSQQQWDILGDSDGAQTPIWSGPSTYPDIRVDTCDIQ